MFVKFQSFEAIADNLQLLFHFVQLTINKSSLTYSSILSLGSYVVLVSIFTRITTIPCNRLNVITLNAKLSHAKLSLNKRAYFIDAYIVHEKCLESYLEEVRFISFHSRQSSTHLSFELLNSSSKEPVAAWQLVIKKKQQS